MKYSPGLKFARWHRRRKGQNKTGTDISLYTIIDVHICKKFNADDFLQFNVLSVKLCCVFNAYLANHHMKHCQVMGKRRVCELAHWVLIYIAAKDMAIGIVKCSVIVIWLILQCENRYRVIDPWSRSNLCQFEILCNNSLYHLTPVGGGYLYEIKT